MKRVMSAVCLAAFTMSPAAATEDPFGLDLAMEYCVFASDDLDISDTATIGHIDVHGVVGAIDKVTIVGSPHVFSEIRGATIILNPDPSGFDPPIALGDNAIAVDDFVATHSTRSAETSPTWRATINSTRSSAAPARSSA